MEPLKDSFFNRKFYRRLAGELHQVYAPLDEEQFYKEAIRQLSKLELKQRMRRTTEVVHKYLPVDYRKALDVLYRFADGKDNEFGWIFLSDYVACYGLDDWDASLPALRDFTRYCTSEFAVREFLQKDFSRTIKEVELWSRHQDVYIRRLASEGCRPRLPWGQQLKMLVANPAPVWPILDNLKADKEKYVQKSVANHLNDISKDHPDWLIKQLKTWDNQHEVSAWIIRHGCRTLIKQGNKKAMKLLGFSDKPKVLVKGFVLAKSSLQLGQEQSFEFKLESRARSAQKLAVDFKVHYMKSNGSTQAKVFKLKEVQLAVGEERLLKKRFGLKPYTTRKHYEGKHSVEIIINGKSFGQKDFILKV